MVKTLKKVSIIIPTKEEPYIQELVRRIHKVLSGFDFEIIVVDKSKVTPKIKGAKVIKQKSNGLGNAILEGLKVAKGDIIVTMDGDGSHRPEDLLKLLEKAKEYDIVIGSKYVKGGKTKDKLYRILISRVYCWFASLVLGLKIRDNMSGFAAIRREVFNKVKLNPRGFKINTEILYKTKKFGLKVAEVPIIFEQRKLGKSKGTLKEGIRTLRFILELKFGLR
ncbi:MAG: glycosyltransferase [Candidatus Aenigmarchaeota archaeon]|nr:glycosyltransferase [Candidatus Aenigmarchaeota archaeon]